MPTPTMAQSTLSREAVARRIWSALHHSNKTKTNASASDVDSLLEKNYVDIVGTYDLPLSAATSECLFKCNASIKGSLAWVWSEDSVGAAQSKCTSLRINIENVSLNFSSKKREDGLQETLGQWRGENEGNAPSANINDPIFFGWLCEVSSFTEIYIDIANVEFESEMKTNEATNLLYNTIEANGLNLLLGNSNLKLFHRVKIKELNAIHDNSNGNGRSFGCQLNNYFCCGLKWTLQKAVFTIPVLTYQLELECSGINAGFRDTGLDVNIKLLNSCRLSDSEMSRYLKRVLRYTSMRYDNDSTGLKICFTDHIIIGTQQHNQPMRKSVHVPLAVPVQIEATHITENTKSEESLVSLKNIAISMIPLHPFVSTVTASFRASTIDLNNVLHLNSVSCQCSVDTATSFVDNFSCNIDSASFEADSRGVKWLQNVIHDATHNSRPIKLPYAQVYSVKVGLLPKGLMTVFKSNVLELNSIDGEGDATSSSIITTLATKLLEEVNNRRNAEKDQRADVADSVALTAGSMLMGASIATPAGAVVAVASLGVRDTVGSAVTAGKESRGVSEHESYQFGDFSRGLFSHARKFTSRNVASSREQSDLSGVENTKTSVLKDKKRLAGVGGMSAGAVVGSMLLGPVGLIGGSLIGSRLAKSSVSDSNKECSNEEENIRRDGEFDKLEGGEDACRDNSSDWW